MAKFTPSFGNLSGKVGGLVFSHNSYGAYVRRLTIPANPATIPQSTRRNQLAYAADYWASTLTEEQRLMWDAFAAGTPAPGVPTGKLSGLGWFVHITCNLVQAGLIVSPTPPITWAGEDLINAACFCSPPPHLTITFAPTPLPPDCRLVVEFTPALKQSIKYAKSLYRLTTITSAAVPTPIDCLSDWESIFGTMPSNGPFHIYARCHILDNSIPAVAYDSSRLEREGVAPYVP